MDKSLARLDLSDGQREVAAASKVESTDDVLYEEFAEQLPKPAGYRILIALPRPDDTTEGGVAKAAQTMRDEEIGAICGKVLELGPDAYKDREPYCKVGDWILMRPYSGTRFSIDGVEFRLLNDVSVEGTVADPKGVTRV